MTFTQLSTNQPGLFPEPEGFTPFPALRVRSGRSRNRAAWWWQQDLSRTATYLLGQARTEDERAFVEQLYEQAIEEGPDFINYRAKSAFEAAPRLGIDRNAYARILNALDMIERGTYRHCREKGKQGIPRTVARVLKCLLNLALHYGEVRPSLDGSGVGELDRPRRRGKLELLRAESRQASAISKARFEPRQASASCGIHELQRALLLELAFSAAAKPSLASASLTGHRQIAPHRRKSLLLPRYGL